MNTLSFKLIIFFLIASGLTTLAPWATASDELPRLAADDRAALEENIGNEVLVTGTIRNIGNTSDGRITFLNFGGPRDNGFVAVIFERYYSAFPNGFSEFRGQVVTVRGVLEYFRNQQPQIRVETANQITFADANAEEQE